FLFLRVLRCFSSPGLPSWRYGFTPGYCPITDSGLPHSEIPGSQLAYSSPRHIGVCPVLHRLLVPRHPPCALRNLTFLGDRALGRAFLVIQFSKNERLKGHRTLKTDKTKQNPGFFVLIILRKEVIQPHLPIRLPCYD